MTHRATLGTDPRGNLTRIDNALAQMSQRLEAAKAQLDNLYQQQAAAKEEVGKPFLCLLYTSLFYLFHLHSSHIH